MNESAGVLKGMKSPSIIIVIYALALTAYTAVTKIEGPASIVNQVRVNTTRLSILETELSSLKYQISYNREENKDDHNRILNKVDALLRDTRELKSR